MRQHCPFWLILRTHGRGRRAVRETGRGLRGAVQARDEKDEIEQQSGHAAKILRQAAAACSDHQRAAPHGIKIKEGGDEREANRRNNAGYKLAGAAHPMNQEFQRVVGQRKTDGHSESRGPRRFGFAERFRERAVKTRRDGAKEKFSLHRGKRSGQPCREVRKEENGSAQERTEESGFPVPALNEDGERIAQQAKEDGADRAVRAWRAGAVDGGRQICTRSMRAPLREAKASALARTMRQLPLGKHSGAFKIWSILCNLRRIG